MKDIEEFVREYYQTDKSGVEMVSIKSAARLARRYADAYAFTILLDMVKQCKNPQDAYPILKSTLDELAQRP